MKAAVLVFGFLTALIVGLIALFTLGELAAVLAFLVVLGTSVWVAAAGSALLVRRFVILSVLLLLAGSSLIVWQGLAILEALTGTDGPADPADPVLLAAAHGKINRLSAEGGFSLELSDEEIEAVIQDALNDGASPLARVAVDVVDGTDGGPGSLHFTGEFKTGNLTVNGVASASISAGAVEVKLDTVDMGMVTLPGLAKNAVADLFESIADLNDTLARTQADVQSVELGEGRLLITGTQGSGALLTSQDLLDGLAAQAQAAAGAVPPPLEQLGPGVVNSTSADGPTYYVALGDSLTANVGVSEPRDGFVSRVHNQLQLRDGESYGLRNFGVPGETTGTLIRNGQLDAAVAFMQENPVTFVTIGIGANDLLGHLGSADCAETLDAPACRHRLDSAFVTFEQNLVEILDRLTAAAPDATIVFMLAYNPFSLGFGASVGLEAKSNETLSAFNDVAASLATARGLLVADAFIPMLNTSAVTTHMLAADPDIHPNTIGHDILGVSIMEALGA